MPSTAITLPPKKKKNFDLTKSEIGTIKIQIFISHLKWFLVNRWFDNINLSRDLHLPLDLLLRILNLLLFYIFSLVQQLLLDFLSEILLWGNISEVFFFYLGKWNFFVRCAKWLEPIALFIQKKSGGFKVIKWNFLS